MNELAKPEQTSWEIVEKQADVLVKSGILPEHWASREKVLSGAIYAQSLGVHWMVVIQNCWPQDGKVSMQVSLMEALAVQRCGLTLECIESTNEKAHFVGHRQGWKDYHSIFTIEDAERAGLLYAACKCYERGKGYRKDCWKCHGTGKVKKANWEKYPRQMLAARAKSDICRFMAADAFFGMAVYTPDELEIDAPIPQTQILEADVTAVEDPEEKALEAKIMGWTDEKSSGAVPAEAAEQAHTSSPTPHADDKPVTDEMSTTAPIPSPKAAKKREADLSEAEISADNDAGRELQPKLWSLVKHICQAKGWKDKDVMVMGSEWEDSKGKKHSAANPDDFWHILKRGHTDIVHCRIAWMRAAYGRLKELCTKEGIGLPEEKQEAAKVNDADSKEHDPPF